MVDLYRERLRTSTLADSAYINLNGEYFCNADWLASTHKYVISPMESSLACQVCAYAMLKCQEIFKRLVWYRSLLSCRMFVDKFPKTDFSFWVMYGSWSFCGDCGSLHFNDKYFSEVVYQTARTTDKPEFMAAYRRSCPTDAVEHNSSQIGVSSRWWYLAGMYKPVSPCGSCTRSASGMSAGAAFTHALRDAHQRHYDSAVQSTSQLYRVPRLRPLGASHEPWALECIQWPRFENGQLLMYAQSGESMLELNSEESRSL